jgi:hypothetical protein
MACKITIRDTSIYDCARSGINIGDGCWGGHLIERCDVFDTVLETHDHGSFNSWGRDRYWMSNHRGVSEPEVKKDPKLPFLDVIEPITIRDSRWRCDHGWDIDLDDGSSNYRIYNNLMLAGGLKFREGYGRKAWNNVLVNSGFHPHVWFDDSGSQFQRNIVMAANAPIGQPEGWGREVDHNFFVSEADLRKSQAGGADINSLSGDPLFMNPAEGDFRVKEDSPALKTGFKNFPMDQFGVKKPSLKAIAKTPVIPELKLKNTDKGSSPSALGLFWLGAPLHSLQGEEFSAFGVAKDDGGVQLVRVPKDSAAAKAGFQDNDLIQSLNGRKIANTDQLFAALLAFGPQPPKARIIRNQQPKEMALPSLPFVSSETAAEAGAFRVLVPSKKDLGPVSANPSVNNEPTAVLTDGKLAGNYGPVFANGARCGAYKIDLRVSQTVRAITSWSFNQNGNRGRQLFTVYGSNSATDPGWDTGDVKRFAPLGTIDSASLPSANFTATTLRAPKNGSLGTFRWIVWQTAPVTGNHENTAWQEFSVESDPIKR